MANKGASNRKKKGIGPGRQATDIGAGNEKRKSSASKSPRTGKAKPERGQKANSLSQSSKKPPSDSSRTRSAARERGRAEISRASVSIAGRFPLTVDEVRAAVKEEMLALREDFKTLRSDDEKRMFSTVADAVRREAKQAKRLIIRCMVNPRSEQGSTIANQGGHTALSANPDREAAHKDIADEGDGAPADIGSPRFGAAEYERLKTLLLREKKEGQKRSTVRTMETILVAMHLHEMRRDRNGMPFTWKSTGLDHRTYESARPFLRDNDWIGADHVTVEKTANKLTGETRSEEYWLQPVLKAYGRPLAECIYDMNREKWDSNFRTAFPKEERGSESKATE